MNFWQKYFDKLLLTGLLLLLGLLLLHSIHHSTDDSIMAWIEQTFATILGALLSLITGRALASAVNGKNGGHGPPTNGNGAIPVPGGQMAG